MGASVDVAGVAAAGGQGVEFLAGALAVDRAHRGDGLDQRALHIGRHPTGVAADVEMRAAINPLDQCTRALADQVLHVTALGLVARERHIQPLQLPLLERLQPLGLVEKLVTQMAMAEVQPVATTRALGDALLQEGAEGCDAGPGGGDGHPRQPRRTL